tara:strand:+ start:420 stop:578 length:159 start_codon:yes stop_codon:yes gene_type:complete
MYEPGPTTAGVARDPRSVVRAARLVIAMTTLLLALLLVATLLRAQRNSELQK